MSSISRRPYRRFWIALFFGCLVGFAVYVSLHLYSQTDSTPQTKIPRTFSVKEIVQLVHADRAGAEKNLTQWTITLHGRVFQVIPAHGMFEVLFEPARGGWVAAYLSKERAIGLKRGAKVRVECSFLELQDHPALPHTIKIWLHRCAD